MYQVSFNVDTVSECPRVKLGEKNGKVIKEPLWAAEPSRADLLDGSGFCITGFIETLDDLNYLATALKEKGIHNFSAHVLTSPWP